MLSLLSARKGSFVMASLGLSVLSYEMNLPSAGGSPRGERARGCHHLLGKADVGSCCKTNGKAYAFDNKGTRE